jgi:tetratricopeptide (TPR) repeat protein
VLTETQGDLVRYRLLESTRAYAAEKLAVSGEIDVLVGRHLQYFRETFANLAHDAANMKRGRAQAIHVEQADVRFALDEALGREAVIDGAALLASIGDSWHLGGLTREGTTLLEIFLARLPKTQWLLSAQLATALTFIYNNTGRHAQARDAGNAAVVSARASGDDSVLAAALSEHATALIFGKDLSGAQAALTEAESIGRVSPLTRAKLLEMRAHLSMEEGDLDAAERAFSQLRETFRLQRDRVAEGLFTCQLGDIAFRRGEYQRSAELLREATEHSRDRSYYPYFLVQLGSGLICSGDVAAAGDAALEAIAIWAPREPEHVHVTQAIELLAYVTGTRGDGVRAAQLAAYAAASFSRLGYSRDFVPQAILDRLTPLLHDLLAHDELARLSAEGAALTPDAAIALARASAAGAPPV